MSEVTVRLPLEVVKLVARVMAEAIVAEGETRQDYPDPPAPTRETIALPDSPEKLVAPESGFVLGATSRNRLATCHPVLQRVALRAIQITTQDFTVFEGVRTAERQRELVRRGVSRTNQSKHLRQSDGFSHAFDLVSWIDGKAVWDWDGCFRIACAVDMAATEQGVAHKIRWGGAWDRTLADFGNDPAAYAQEVQAYRKRRGGRAFLDGAHFELV